MKRTAHMPLGAPNFLSILEGVEGGFAIFAGIIIGLSFTGIEREYLIVTGFIGIIVNAFNSSAVRYATEHYLDELDGRETRHPLRRYFLPAFIEFMVYALVSGLSIIPLLIVPSLIPGAIVTALLAIVILYLAGWYRGHLMRHHPIRDGLELASIGALIIAVGGLSGRLLSWIVNP